MSDNLPDQTQTEIGQQLERMTALGPFGSLESPIGRTLWGLNHRSQPGIVPIHKDQQGYVFFSRPCLNLTGDNIKVDRRLAFLLTDNSTSINAYIRCMLDPRLQGDGAASCDFVDPRQPFIPILTNTIESFTGFRDTAPATYTSAEGMYKESRSWIDGPSVDYTTYDIPGSFRNILGNVVTRMAFVWSHYQSLVMAGDIVPYPEYWLNCESDYDTRIFKLNMDSTKTYVTQITSTIGFPTSAPIGASANFENNGPFNRGNEQVSVNFRCHGNETYDAILMLEFNQVVEFRNPDMKDGARESLLRKIPAFALPAFNHAGYPRINLDTSELEWWIPVRDYNQVMGLSNDQ